MKKYGNLGLMILVACVFLSGGMARQSFVFAEDKIAAIVNKDVITVKDLNDFISFTRMQYQTEYQGRELEAKLDSMKKDLLEKLIEDRLIVQEARKSNLKLDPNRVTSRINEIKHRYASDGQFQEALTKQGLTIADVESKIKEQMIMYYFIDSQIKNRITVKPAEVTEFYQQHIAEFAVPEERRFDTVVTEDAHAADEAFQKLKNSGSVQSDSVSVNTMSALKGGQLKKEIEDIVFKTGLNEIAGPVEIEKKYYIFKVNAIIPPKQQALPEVQERIYAFLFDRKMQEKLSSFVDELKQKAYIKIF
ncbi:MAG TPA: peptidyl-prolyl cis-trans isomerase [Patescibacteria group bacterium]|nr:peptidyl-prolyl cis-trans isomerase [Patescibacteria group bacterium]